MKPKIWSKCCFCDVTLVQKSNSYDRFNLINFNLIVEFFLCKTEQCRCLFIANRQNFMKMFGFVDILNIFDLHSGGTACAF